MADALITEHIPNLINGVTQQATTLRRADQCEAQENCRNSLVDGMGKRPNSVLRGATGITEDITHKYITTIHRDEAESYKLIIDSDEVRVFDAVSGVEYPVVLDDPEVVEYLGINADIEPERAYQVLTTIDSSLILNKTKAVEYLPYDESNLVPVDSEARTAILSINRMPYWGHRRISCTTDGVTYQTPTGGVLDGRDPVDGGRRFVAPTNYGLE